VELTSIFIDSRKKTLTAHFLSVYSRPYEIHVKHIHSCSS